MIIITAGVPFPPVIENKEKEISLPNFNLSWNPPNNKPGCPLTMYTVYIKEIRSPDKENAQFHTSTTAMTALPLDCGTDYEFAVSAWNEFGEGNLSQSWQGRVVTGISLCFLLLSFFKGIYKTRLSFSGVVPLTIVIGHSS